MYICVYICTHVHMRVVHIHALRMGLYLWGGTGTGKTFMMNMFYDKLNVKNKKRIHFHEWMIDVHSRQNAQMFHDFLYLCT